MIEVGIIGGDKSWHFAGRKIVFLLLLIIGVEDRRILNSKNLHIKVDKLSTAEICTLVEQAFIRPQKYNIRQACFHIKKQLENETVEQFYGKPGKLAENGVYENNEETLFRDAFITNLIKIGKELLKQTVETRKSLELALYM